MSTRFKISILPKLQYYITLLLAISIPVYERHIPVLIIVFVLLWILQKGIVKSLNSIKTKRLAILFISFYIIHVVGMLYSENTDFGLFDLQIKLPLLLFPLIFVTLPKMDSKQFNMILYGFLMGCTIAIVMCSTLGFIKFKQTGIDSFYYSRLSVFLHPGYLSMYLNLAVIIIIYFIFERTSKISWLIKVFLYMLMLLFIVFIFLLAAKSGIISLFVVFVIAVTYLVFKKKKMISAILFLSVFAFLFIISKEYNVLYYQRLIETKQYYSNKNIDKNSVESTTARLLIWPVVLDAIKENIVFGVGTGDIKDVLLLKYKENNLKGVFEKKLNAHSQFLQTTLALGLIGGSLLVTGLLIPFIISLINRNYLYSLFILIVTLHFFVESILEVQAGVVFYAFFNSLFAFEKEQT